MRDHITPSSSPTFFTKTLSHREPVVKVGCLAWICSKCTKIAETWSDTPPHRCRACLTVDCFRRGCGRRCGKCERWMVGHEDYPRALRVGNERLIGAAKGALFAVESYSRCDCMTIMDREVRFIAERLVPFSGTRVTLGSWAKIVESVRGRFVQRFPVFRNAALFTDALGNLVAVTVLPERGAGSLEGWVGSLKIDVVVRGCAPWAWKDGLPEIAQLGTFDPLCARCAQNDILGSVATTKAQVTLGEARTGRTRTLKREKLTCPAGHTVTLEEQVGGVPLESAADPGAVPPGSPGATQHHENAWRPASGKLFFTETERSGLWWGCGDCARAGGASESQAVFTSLGQAEVSPARVAEYSRARGLFYSFLGAELSTKVELVGVVFVRHIRREEMFSAMVFDIHQRQYQRSGSPQAWGMWATRKEHGANKIEGGDGVVLGWQGMSLGRAHETILRSSEEKVTFTLTAAHAIACAKDDASKVAGSAPPASQQEPSSSPSHGRCCLLASWVAPGRVRNASDQQPASPGSPELGLRFKSGSTHDSKYTVFLNHESQIAGSSQTAGHVRELHSLLSILS